MSSRLMREMAGLARGLGVRLHTHLAETRELHQALLVDVALWRVDTLAHDAIARNADPDGPEGDPVAALVFGPPAPLELVLVGGTPVVEPHR